MMLRAESEVSEIQLPCQYFPANTFADLILSHGQDGMTTSLFTVGPYMNMLFDGMFVPDIEEDGTVVWWNPAGLYPSLHCI
jgi:hypothetical protein